MTVPVRAGSVIVLSAVVSAAVNCVSNPSAVVPSKKRELPSFPAVSVNAAPVVTLPTAVMSPPAPAVHEPHVGAAPAFDMRQSPELPARVNA